MPERDQGKGGKTGADKGLGKVRNRRAHMANERTFLAWMRTSIAIMAFGFVVERFTLFVRQMEYLLGKTVLAKEAVGTGPAGHGYSAVLGIFLVGLGALMGVLSFVRYKKVERQIDEDAYQPSLILDVLLTISVLVIGIFLITYLVWSI